jgi:signal transduction histidine kinase
LDIPDLERIPSPATLKSLRQACANLGLLLSSIQASKERNIELTERSVELEKSLAAMTKERRALEALLQMRAQLYNNTLHDLRNPIAALRGYIKMSIDGPIDQTGTTRERFLALALEHANSLTGLLASLDRQISQTQIDLARSSTSNRPAEIPAFA